MEEQLALEQRVWQRVRGLRSPEQDLEEALEGLIRLGREQTAGLKPWNPPLYRQEMENLSLLTALYHLKFGRHLPGQPRVRPSREDCRRRAAKMLQLYVQLESHRDFGALFTHLTRRQRAICAALEGYSRSQGFGVGCKL